MRLLFEWHVVIVASRGCGLCECAFGRVIAALCCGVELCVVSGCRW